MFKAPFSFNGRIGRLEYAISFGIYLAIFIPIKLIVKEDSDSIYNIFGLATIPLLWFLWAQGAKRCHDLSNSGWYQIIPFYFILLIFQQGVMGENEYGEDPREPERDHVYVRPEGVLATDEIISDSNTSKPLEEL